VILLDGAMGTELERRGAVLAPPLWSARALLDQPSSVQQIHEDYLRAGAQVITTNTFRTHARNLAAAGLEQEAGALTVLAVELARAARATVASTRPDVARAKVAGSVSPLEDCWHPERSPAATRAEPEHRAMVEALARAGCDLLLVETMGRVDEAVVATRVARRLLPTWLSVTCGTDGRLLGGETFDALAQALGNDPPEALLVNCIDLDVAVLALPALAAAGMGLGCPIGLYPHVGGHAPGGAFVPRAVGAEAFAGRLVELAGPYPEIAILGACCGSTPEWIEALARRVHPTVADRRRGFAALEGAS
jgi:homocysteine S-methyltransferase